MVKYFVLPLLKAATPILTPLGNTKKTHHLVSRFRNFKVLIDSAYLFEDNN